MRIIYPEVTRKSEGYKGAFISHYNDEHYRHAGINLKEENPGWKKAKPVETVYIKYEPENNLPDHEYILPKQR